MIRRLAGPFIVFLLLSLGSLGIHFFQSKNDEATQLKTSGLQASKGTIRIGLDGYAGYFPLRSDQLRASLLREGYRIELVDDEGDYEGRVAELESGKLDMAVFTIDSYILNGARANYPGSIVAVLSESTGSDAIVSATPTIQTLDDIKNTESLRIAYTPNSPSQHLLKSVAVDFGMTRLLKENRSWSVPVSGSVDALEALEKQKAEVGILWEPELSAAIKKKGYTRILGTESTSGLIVDVLVVNRRVLSERPELVEQTLSTYFKTLEGFRKDRKSFIETLSKDSNSTIDTAKEMANGIAWKGFEANLAVWLGLGSKVSPVSEFRLYDSIERTLQILIECGDFTNSPLPQGDPRSLIFTGAMQKLASSADYRSTNQETSELSSVLTNEFSAMSQADWLRLPQVGTLKLRPISFQSGTNTLSPSGVEAIEQMIQSLKHYPSFRVIVSGHTSARGDPDANRTLSSQRAQGVVDYIITEYAVDPNRLLAIGSGSDQPLSRAAGESFRAFQNRLSRVEFAFVRDSL